MKGRVIGVATFQMLQGQNLNFAVPVARLTTLKQKQEADKNTRPTSTEIDCRMGKVHLWRDDFAEALPLFQKAVEKNPEYDEAWFYKGYCQDELGLYAEEITAYKQAIRIEPDFADAHYNLGIAYLIMGDRGSVLEQYKILKDLDKELANRLFNAIYE